MSEDDTGDPIVDEVRAIRAQIAQECGYDVGRIAARAQALAEKTPGIQFVTVEQMRARRGQRRAAETAVAAGAPAHL